MNYRAYTLYALLVAPHDVRAADTTVRAMLDALSDGDVLNAALAYDDEGPGGFGCDLERILIPAPQHAMPVRRPRAPAWPPVATARRTVRLPVGASAVFSLPDLLYQPVNPDLYLQYLEGYVGTLTGRWHGHAEFTATSTVATAIVERLSAPPNPATTGTNHIGFDGQVLRITAPPSLGGGTHLVHPDADGRYPVGWAMGWHDVDPALCDHIIGTP